MSWQVHIIETQNRTKNVCFYRSDSTGKERDEETGYGYFGARYMDHELMTMWLSVDPMADKYPSISPYAYCAWNPIKFVDPDGRIIDSASVTQEIKDLINPLHTSYNEEFASVYQALEADPSVTYRFERWNEFHINKEGKATSGGTTLADDRAVVIGYTWGLETTINKENTQSRALCEEICHAKQFCDGKWGFAKTHGVLWVTCGNIDEEEAHIWAARVSGSTSKVDYSHYNLDQTTTSAEHAWIKDNPAVRRGTTPKYDNNGLYSAEFWFFKQPKK